MKREALLVVSCLIPVFLYAQKPNWQNLDLQKDSVFGASTEKAYSELLRNKKGDNVIVAIIDTGIDTAHEDLKGVLWTNPETGIHGWNYIGAETGREDVTNLIGDNNKFYDSLSYTLVPEIYRAGYQQYKTMRPALEAKISFLQQFITELGKYDTKEAKDVTALARYHLAHGLNINNNEPDTAKGNADITPDETGPVPDLNLSPYHGTHIAGIIAATRNNGRGMDGIADHVEIMMLKVYGNIRELRDEALARAIRFAVDNGSKIINLSLGKPYTWNKKAVDSAVQYAMVKDVLIVHAAGNDGVDLDHAAHFPNPQYLDNKGKAGAWIEVGASGMEDNNDLVASFSNYGKTTVDVFAPGEQIYSAIPGNQYKRWSGTSMATPVVAGIAALIREYYPELTAVQVKDIIMKSVVKRDILKDRCISRGVVNAYNALKLAATF